MNQLFLSAVFLQKTLSYNPRKTIFYPEVSTEQSLRNLVNWKNQENFAEDTLKERNRNFFRQLVKPKSSTGSLLKKESKEISKLSREKWLNKKFAQKTTLIIAPHPDDEILGLANLIKEKIKSHEKIKIIYVTNGDAAKNESLAIVRNYGHLRRIESTKATQALGLNKTDLFFLGFPDGSLDKLLPTNSIENIITGEAKTSRNSYFPNFKFSKKMLLTALERIIKKTNPDEIYVTSPQDNHPDHSFLGEMLINNFTENSAKKFTYIIHHTDCKNEICECTRPVDTQKLKLINFFQSQRFSEHYQKFLDQYALQKETFKEIK
jgi:LmbE family N-acetylglucosaminyl deacetylase